MKSVKVHRAPPSPRAGLADNPKTDHGEVDIREVNSYFEADEIEELSRELGIGLEDRSSGDDDVEEPHKVAEKAVAQ